VLGASQQYRQIFKKNISILEIRAHHNTDVFWSRLPRSLVNISGSMSFIPVSKDGERPHLYTE
jgi:hypothetical protein